MLLELCSYNKRLCKVRKQSPKINNTDNGGYR